MGCDNRKTFTKRREERIPESLDKWFKKRRSLRRKLIKLLGGSFNNKDKLRVKVIQKDNLQDYTREKFVYQLETGEIIQAYILIPAKAKPPIPAILCLHQHNKEYHLGKSELVGLSGSSDQHYALELTKKGYITLSFDAKCFEERARFDIVDGNEEGMGYERLVAMNLLLEGRTLQWRMLSDIIHSVDYLFARDEVDKDRIGCIGHSLGGQETMWAMAMDERIKVGVSSCGFSTYKEIIKHNIIHNFAAYIPNLLKCIDIPDLVSLIAPRSFLILAGKEDPLFPFKGVQEVYNQAEKVYGLYKEKGKVKLLPHSGEHVFPRSIRMIAYRWFDQWLK